jgi:hypothetical protein
MSRTAVIQRVPQAVQSTLLAVLSTIFQSAQACFSIFWQMTDFVGNDLGRGVSENKLAGPSLLINAQSALPELAPNQTSW